MLFGGILTGIIIPVIMRRWQTRQKNLEIKTSLVSEISESVMRILMQVQFFNIIVKQYKEKNPSKPLSFTEFPELKAENEKLNESYKNWEIYGAIIDSKLTAYFSNTKIPEFWREFSECIRLFYGLEGIYDKKNYDQTSKRIAQKLCVLLDRADIKDDWSSLRQGILDSKSLIINNILQSRIRLN